MVEPKAGKRHTIVRKKRKYKDYSLCMYSLANFYDDVEKIIVIQDNLNTHTEKSLIKAFGEKKAQEIMQKFEFHYTPKHGSWLNMAEIEISVLETECLNKRRIPDRRTLHCETSIWKKRRNEKKAQIMWGFTRERAREKFNLEAYQN